MFKSEHQLSELLNLSDSSKLSIRKKREQTNSNDSVNFHEYSIKKQKSNKSKAHTEILHKKIRKSLNKIEKHLK